MSRDGTNGDLLDVCHGMCESVTSALPPRTNGDRGTGSFGRAEHEPVTDGCDENYLEECIHCSVTALSRPTGRRP
jgi:hypothetical protein